jgi:hypothetical protein
VAAGFDGAWTEQLVFKAAGPGATGATASPSNAALPFRVMAGEIRP